MTADIAIFAREIPDSRGNPTVGVDVTTTIHINIEERLMRTLTKAVVRGMLPVMAGAAVAQDYPRQNITIVGPRRLGDQATRWHG